jgi:hypothetical protein
MYNNAFLEPKKTTTVAAVGTSFDVSGVTGDYTVFLRVLNLVGTVRFAFEDSVNAFTASLTGPTYSMQGDLKPAFPVTKSFVRRDFPSLRMGIPSGVLRATVTELTGPGATVTYEAYIQY